MADRDAILRPFADRLEELRLAAGGPSYAELTKLSGSLKRSTISDVLRARSRPSLDFVVAFVAACHAYARSRGDAIDDRYQLDGWRRAWLDLQRQLGALRRAEPDPAAAAPAAGPVASPPVPRQLPPAPAPFVGREPYLAALDELLHPDGGPAALVVDGPAGVGKTALVVHWAHRARPHFPDGDLYLDLRGYGPESAPLEATDALRALLQATQAPTALVQTPDDPDQLSVRWRSVLAQRRMLVVLDNAESSAQVRPLLPGPGGSTVVVTSRRRLSGLVVRDGAAAFGLAAMTPAESRELLATVLGEQLVGDPRAGDPHTVDELARRCDYSPLALRILAERVVSQPRPLADVLAELDSDTPLSAIATDDGDHTAAIRTVLGWSYRALAEPAARMFRLLSLHPGPHLLAGAAAALAGQPPPAAEQALRELADIHLVAERGPARFQLHDLLRHLSTEVRRRTDTGVDAEAALRREVLWYLHSAAAADRFLSPGRRSVLGDAPPPELAPAVFARYDDALAWCDAERDNLLGLVQEAYRHRWDDLCWQLPTILLGYFNLRKAWPEWLATFAVALRAAHRAQDRYAEAVCANALGIAYRELRRYGPALAHFAVAVRRFRELGNAEGECLALNNVAVVYQHDPQREVPVLRRALAAARSGGFARAELTVLHNLGEAYLKLAQFGAASACAWQCLHACARAGDRAGVGLALASIGETYARQRRFAEAWRFLGAAIALHTEAGDVAGEAVTVFRLARSLAAAGERSAAADRLRRARRVLEDLGDPLAADVRAFQRRL